MASETFGNYAHLLPAGWADVIQRWFQEDSPSIDFAGFVVGDAVETATLYGKSEVVWHFGLANTFSREFSLEGRSSMRCSGNSAARSLLSLLILTEELNGTSRKEWNFLL